MLEHDDLKAFLEENAIPYEVKTKGDAAEVVSEEIIVKLSELTDKQRRLVTTYGE